MPDKEVGHDEIRDRERPPGEAAQRVLTLFSRGEAFDAAGLAELFTERPVYQFGNSDVCLTRGEIGHSASAFFRTINAVYHDIRDMEEVGDRVFVEMDVHYWRKADNSHIALPRMDVFRLADDRFSELRIFLDVNPLSSSGAMVPENLSVYTVAGGERRPASGAMKRFFAQNPEGTRRVREGFAPKWSSDGPRWAVGEDAAWTVTELEGLAPDALDMGVWASARDEATRSGKARTENNAERL